MPDALGLRYAAGSVLQLLCATIELALYLMLTAAALHLARQARWALMRGPVPAPSPAPPTARTVTVQLPLRNEVQMAEGVVRAAAALVGRDVEVQVLDDSDDETRVIVDRVSAELRALGHEIHVIRRADRRGYKAGNLAYGMATARGEYFLVLDADFRPEPQLLAQLAHSLDEDLSLAFCQARWSYRNATTPLRHLQASILDALFAIEQAALSEAHAPLQFNGTAGMWRRSAIERAGGWDTSDDALTEDLDLSFRAHEAGLRGLTRPELVVSTELPADMASFRGQQARWVRGGALTLRSLGARLVRNASAKDALTIGAHLARHARQPLFVAAIVRLPFIAFGAFGSRAVAPVWLGPLVVSGAIASATLYLAAGARRVGRPVRPLEGLRLALLSLGLAPTLSVAFVGGLLGNRGRGFVRTTKLGDAPQIANRSLEPLAATLALVSLVALAGFARAHDVVGVAGALLAFLGTGWVSF